MIRKIALEAFFYYLEIYFSMKTKSPLFSKVTFNFSKIFILLIIFIIFFSFSLLFRFNQKITPQLLSIAEVSINKLNANILSNYRVKDLYSKVNLDNTISITKNKNDEIISVDFKLESAYDALAILTQYLQENLTNLKQNNLNYYNEYLSRDLNSIVLTIPLGIATNNLYLAHLGPKIPVKVTYMDYIASNIRLKVENYGLNNALISLYIDCSITNEFIIPTTNKQINHTYSILIASKIIQGIIPAYYGGLLETKSNILNVPLN